MTTAARHRPFPHGKVSGYRRGCRLDCCRPTIAPYSKRARWRAETGNYLKVSTAACRCHIERLRAAGMGDRQIAEAAQVARSSVYRCMVAEKMHRHTIDKIMTVTAPNAPHPDLLADPTGARRLMRALVLAGWPIVALARLANISDNTIRRLVNEREESITVAVDLKLRKLFRSLISEQPENQGVSAVNAAHARALAAARGWHPAGVWDDIDDPSETPNYGAWSSRDEALVEDTAELFAQGCSREQITARLGATWAYITKAHSRLGTPLPHARASLPEVTA